MPPPSPPPIATQPTHKLIWHGSEHLCDRIADFLSEVYDPPAAAVSLLRAGQDAADTDTSWQVEAYFPEEPIGWDINRQLQKAGIDAPAPLREIIAPRDWVAHALEGLGIVTCGRFTLYGSHDAHRVAGGPGTISIRIDANQAFGTGHHPTTAGCLDLLDRYLDRHQGLAPRAILDLGTGSAVLAIAARKIWTGTVVASDIDPVSVEIAKENAALNDAGALDFVCAAGFDHEQITNAAPYDFIFANILAGPLKALAPGMGRYCAAEGHVMLAGLMLDQEAGVVAAYDQAGFVLEDRRAHETWPVLMLRRA